MLDKLAEKLSELQQLHYASNRYAVLLIFQAMDAAGLSRGTSQCAFWTN
jgi:hypothetical protein